MIFKELRKANKLEQALEANKREFAESDQELFELLQIAEEITSLARKNKPKIDIPSLIIPEEVLVQRKTFALNYKTITLSVIAILTILSFVLADRTTKISPLSGKVIAKELEEIKQNSPIRSLKLEKEINSLIENKNNTQKTEYFPSSSTKIRNLENKEVEELINSL